MNKKKKGFLCLALCLILTVSFGMQGLRVNATNMSSITSDSIRDKQDQIKQAEKEREQMKSNLSNLEQIKKDLETQKTNLKNYVTQLDQNLKRRRNCKDPGGTGCGTGERRKSERCHDPPHKNYV